MHLLSGAVKINVNRCGREPEEVEVFTGEKRNAFKQDRIHLCG